MWHSHSFPSSRFPIRLLNLVSTHLLAQVAALVTTLAAVRGHWLETLQVVVSAAAELLGADSLRCGLGMPRERHG